jgi:hypothetical protein
MWNLGTVHPQSPKNSDTQRKPSPASSAPAAPWIPDSALPPLHQDSINSIVCKTLLATPEFPRLYADMVLSGNYILDALCNSLHSARCRDRASEIGES